MVNIILQKIVGTQNERVLRRYRPIIPQVNAFESTVSQWPDAKFPERTAELRTAVQEALTRGSEELSALAIPRDLPQDQLKDARDKQKKARRQFEERILDGYLPEAFAMVREASKRTTSMRHFDTQLIGGMSLHHGNISEMATGEGKTLVATLAAYLNALSGHGVHIVTVNDYLAKRDRAWMGPIYEFLGLTVGAIQHDLSDRERQMAYACDITYGTNNELGFDYLRDHMKYRKDDVVHRGFHFAIVDEVDSILIDEARTPLIISGPAEESTDLYYQMDRVARRLSKDADFSIDEKARAVSLTEEGVAKAEELLGVENLYDFAHQRYVHHLTKALEAHHLHKVDQEYVVKDHEIIIVDDFTGRLMPGRRWSDGLHQAIEAKEGVRIREENQTLATITFQNYFRMYDKLSGMTGTASTEAHEFKEIYKLNVVTIPTNRPLIRTNFPDQVYRTEGEKFAAVVEEIVRWHKEKRPMLVGTISIEKSERLSGMLASPQTMLEFLRRQCERTAKRLEELRAKAPAWLPATMATPLAALLLKPAQLKPADVQPFIEQLESAAPKEEFTLMVARVATLVDVVDAIRAGVPHHVLNAKQHEREAHIVAQAGRLGAITIATNMAGRGTDILLGGNPDFLAEDLLSQQAAGGKAVPPEERQATIERMRAAAKTEHDQVVAVGGLHVLGTERHEARRIDNQLRGRSGRQGDPGSSRFYLSLEDDLMRIFAPDRIAKLMDFFQWEEGLAIEHGLLTRSIETAQKRVEVHNFEIRKHLLEYDNVMNRQREVIYDERRRLLAAESLRDHVLELLTDVADHWVDRFAQAEAEPEQWDLASLRDQVRNRFGVDCAWLADAAADRDALREQLTTTLTEAYAVRETAIGADALRFHERGILIQMIDVKWKDHLYAMDALREGIGLRAYGQRDPLVEYQHEAFAMFQTMVDAIKEDALELLFKFQVGPAEGMRVRAVFDPARQQLSHPEAAPLTEAPSIVGQGRPSLGEPQFHVGPAPPARPSPATVARALAGSPPVPSSAPKVGRNDPCPCGSGKKFKRCHGS